MTTYWQVPVKYDPEHQAIQEAARLLRDGKQVAFPTETVYGLGADARQSKAVEGVFTAKGRPSDNPLIVHIAQMGMLDELARSVDEVTRSLAEAFWPGPLTLVLPLRPGAVSPKVTAGLDTVAVRMPDHPVALSLIAAAGCPVAAPSANRSGRPSPTLAEHVRKDLDGRIAGLLDGGPTGVGLESTVAMVGADGQVHVLRPGGVSPSQLARVAGRPVVLAGADFAAAQLRDPARPAGRDAGPDGEFTPRAPGMKYTHYAPQGCLIVVKGASSDTVARLITDQLAQAKSRGERTAVLAPREHIAYYSGGAADLVLPCGSLYDGAATARELFGALRRLDEEGMTWIYAEAYPEEGIGLAVMNRLLKAAGYRVLEA